MGSSRQGYNILLCRHVSCRVVSICPASAHTRFIRSTQFWGSSILSSQQDAVKSAQELGGGNVFSANVQGISLSTLTKNTVLAYKPGATPEETKGGLLIIKMDVEGAEYQVLKESAASGVLCDYIQKGNRVVMIVEFHNMSITDPAERKREKEGSAQAKQMLEECGVEFGKLQAFWA